MFAVGGYGMERRSAARNQMKECEERKPAQVSVVKYHRNLFDRWGLERKGWVDLH